MKYKVTATKLINYTAIVEADSYDEAIETAGFMSENDFEEGEESFTVDYADPIEDD